MLTQFSAREYPDLAEVARYLVPRVDPNLSATPQDPRWTPLSRVIQADIRADMPQLGRAFADADQSLVRSLASQMRDADADTLLSFFGSPTGVSYLQFLGDMRAAYASAVRSVLGHVAAQTPISQSGASAAVMQMRRRLVALAVGAASLYRAQDAGSDLAGSGTAPQIRHASYMSPRTGRAFDVTHLLQSACSRGSDGCKVGCGNQLAGDPDFGRVKYCQIAFQCSAHPTQNVTLAEGRSVTLTCAQ